MAYEFRFPDIGEGVTEGELLAWKVKEGDVVAEDQTLAELETDKAVVELPSPRAGRVVKLHGAEGDIVKVGDVVVTIEEGGEGGAAPAAGASVTSVATVSAPKAHGEAPPTEAPPKEAAPAEAAPAEAAPYTGSVVGRLEEAEEEVEPQAEAGVNIIALPSVRALAKELGVDLSALRGTGPGGRILKQDVEDMAEGMAYGVTSLDVSAKSEAAVQSTAPSVAETPVEAGLMGGTIERDEYGPVERVAFRGIRRTMAKHMAESVATQAQVTTMDEADVTIIKRIRDKERTIAAERGVRLTYLAFVVKACTAALKRFPRLNAVLERSSDEFVLKRYYNIGIAIDTKDGLVVPNIKSADLKSIFQIAEEIVNLVDLAENRRLDLRDLHGGTFTITNYGAIGSTFATPVVYYPEVAILGMGRVRELPVIREKQVVTRSMIPLSLTFDHQLIDGAEAARFLNLVIGYIEDPDLLLLEGA